MAEAGNKNNTETENGDAEIIARINAISQNARTTWFGLIGALVFAGITILGVEDVDFFKADNSTKLPLIGVSVPVGYFFGAGALLITSLYIYLHLYLELLWGALGRASARINGKPLSEHIFPWLISEWVLRYRDYLRGASGEDCAADTRAMSWLGTIISLAFVWLFGLVVLAMFWWFLLPAHYLQASAGIGLLLGIAIWVGLKSWRTARKLLKGEDDSLVFGTWADFFGGFSFLIIIWALGLASVWLIEINPKPANLVEVQIVKRPADWQDHEEAEKNLSSPVGKA